MPMRRGETLAKCLLRDNINMKARRNMAFAFMLRATQRSINVYPDLATPL